MEAEIINDELSEKMYNIVTQNQIKTILEIGSCTGEGSTLSFINGIIDSNQQRNCTLFCMELNFDKYNQLWNNHKEHTFINFCNHSSIEILEYPPFEDIKNFYDNVKTNLNQYPLKLIESWYNYELDYLIKNKPITGGIDIIKERHSIDWFDIVLIDGSEFTGLVEFRKIKNSKFIILDDINSFKNYDNYQTLLNHKNYVRLDKNWELRNGYAIFMRK